VLTQYDISIPDILTHAHAQFDYCALCLTSLDEVVNYLVWSKYRKYHG